MRPPRKRESLRGIQQRESARSAQEITWTGRKLPDEHVCQNWKECSRPKERGKKL